MAMAGAIPFSLACGFLMARMTYRTLFIVSFLFPVAGLFMALSIHLSESFIYPALCFFIMGISTGTLMAGDTMLIQESAEEEDRGMAQSTVQLFQTMGASIGMSVFGSLLAGWLSSGLSLTSAFHQQFGMALVFALAAVVICFFFGKGKLVAEAPASESPSESASESQKLLRS
ncbi:MFS transporter [Paenibacillus taihuensis]|uniref:MFS transporter n=1 Tax=Paenibacillus taihuensis TaxID=1156355 RepID=A0A3D9RIP7_9BACL|nr:MFS transporter [Paenibacillus taihuensis]REE78667.1 MFS transporter [Paenibacillus taihuensis]